VAIVIVIFATIYYDVSRSTKHIHVAASHETKTIIYIRRRSLLMLLLYNGPEGSSTQKMFRLNILECRLHSKWDDQGQMVTIRRLSYTANGWNRI